jgi:hypothetical protein
MRLFPIAAACFNALAQIEALASTSAAALTDLPPLAESAN